MNRPDNQQTRVYLDWAATAPLCAASRKAMEQFLEVGMVHLSTGGNANSLHSSGRRAFSLLEESRLSISRDLHARRADEILFTSGATEANNTALFGIVSALKKQAIQAGNASFVPHIISSSIEHDAVLAPIKALRSLGCEVSIIEPNKEGFITEEQLRRALKENTSLVSVQMVNNELGTVQPVAKLAALAHEAGALFHTDAAQALGKVPIDLRALNVDAASFSSHKVAGPKGVGCLYLKNSTPCDPLLLGGGQEFGMRSGTQNVCGAFSFAEACKEAVSSYETESLRLIALRDTLYAALSEHPEVKMSVPVEPGSRINAPHILNFYIPGIESASSILFFDLRGIEVSGGSACSSRSLEPSHVLKAIGLSKDNAYCSLRVSFGYLSDREDLRIFLDALKDLLRQKGRI